MRVLPGGALCAFGWWFVQMRNPELRLPVIKLTWRILLAGVAMGILLYPVSRYSIFLTAPAGFIVYVVAIYFLGAVEPEEWRLGKAGLVSPIGRGAAPETPPVGGPLGGGGRREARRPPKLAP